MGFADPFPGYSLVLRALLFGIVPLFSAWQLVRLRRALHVFQLEGYKRARFLRWCRQNRRRALFLAPQPAKKALALTGRAWRILAVATAVSVLAILLPAAAAHLAGGWPYDVGTWAIASALVFVGAPHILVAADLALSPVQAVINRRYLDAARRKLAAVAPVVIGVTGSFGKTSTKFAIERMLDGEEVLASPGSFNTTMGICRTINERLEQRHRFFVVEMGAYGRGEIRELCDLVHPTVGVLTAIGPAHLERFGSIEAIRTTKYELIESLPPDGIAIMNCDDLEVRALANATAGRRVVRYGLDPAGAPQLTAHDVRVTGDGTELAIVDVERGERLEVATRLLGGHAMGHLLAGVAVATRLGRPLDRLAGPIAAAEAVEHRLQLLAGTGGITVIDDAYNSNPDGAAAALEVLAAMPGRRKVIVTPGIVELGSLQYEANERFGEHAARVADELIVVAPLNRAALVSGAQRADGHARVLEVGSLTEARVHLETLLAAGDVVLFENDLPDHLEE
ncbi:MAG: Mur ligase family protein [Actinomycetota bacterium]